jgi:hypothetical protein
MRTWVAAEVYHTLRQPALSAINQTLAEIDEAVARLIREETQRWFPMAQQIVREEAHRWAPMVRDEVERMVRDELDRRFPK